MYINRPGGPVFVRLPDGTRMSRADLPPRDTRRWVASRKAAIVRAVTHGLMSRGEACEIYELSEEELSSWQEAAARYGERALRATALHEYRQL